MKYKKILLGSALLASLGMINTANAADATIADSVVINFTGVFQDSTCTVDVGNASVKNVDLGVHKTAEITEAGESTAPVGFDVQFSGCGSLTTASVTFTGTQTSNNLFDVSGDNKGSVGVGINAAADVGNYFATGALVKDVTLTDGAATLPLYARFVKIGDTAITTGTETAAVTMAITYK